MGITCTYYRVEDKWIDLLNQLPDEVDEWINQFGTWIGRADIEKRIYDLDMAWDIAQFLLNEYDTSKAKILRKVIRQASFFKKDKQNISSPRYLWSDEVRAICHEDDLKAKWNTQKMLDARMYQSNSLNRQEDWKYIVEQVATNKKAFCEASESSQVLICRMEL